MSSMPTARMSRVRLLAGTALGSLFVIAAGTAAAQQAGSIQLPTLSVEGAGSSDYKVDQPTMFKLTEPLLDTAQSIDTVSKQLMEDQGVTTFADALRNVPGVSLGAGESSWQGSNLNLRGFNARNDIYLDGMRDFGSYYRDPFNLEEIEVLEGPSSILFGRGSAAGAVNQVSKAPTLNSHAEGELSFGTDSTKRVTVDIDQALPELGEGTAVRFTGMAHDSMVAGRPVGEYKRYGLAPSITTGLGTDTRVTLSYFHQTESDIPDYGIPWFRGAPAPVARDNFYGFSSDYLNTDADIVTAKVEHDFDDSITVHNQLRYADYYRSWRDTEPLISGTPSLATPLSSVLVARTLQGGHSRETLLQDQTDVTAKFDTGAIGHTLVVGLEVGPESSDPQYNNASGVPTTSLLSPNNGQAFAGNIYPRIVVMTNTFTVSGYVIDTLKLGEQWDLTGGIRYDHFDSDYESRSFSVPPAATGNVISRVSDKRIDEAPSYRAALVYKPAANGSVYFDYATSFDPSAEALSQIVAVRSLNQGNLFLDPEKNETFEIGTKWDLMESKLRVSAALFRQEKDNARVPSPTNPALNVLGGDLRVNGAEFSVVGHLTEQWQVTASYAYLDSKVIKSAPGGYGLGEPLFNTPKNSFSLWTTYALPYGIEVGGGIDNVSSRLGTNVSPVNLAPGYTTANLMAKWQVTDQFKLQVNVNNITDENYIDQLHGFHVIPGAARSALFSLGYKL